MPLDETDCAVTYKVLILGDHSVGKTALLNCLTGREFQDAMFPTIGVDFVRKIFEVDGALIQLIIWDSAGQERFRSITRLQYKGVQGLILVYDVTCELSFKALKYWMNSLQCDMTNPRGSYEPTPIILCGNKCDLNKNRKVSSATGQKLADKEMAFGFYETSAKTGENVHTMFQSLAYHITDICNPKLMKSYHPYLIRPVSKGNKASTQQEKLREFKGKKKNKVKDKNAKGHCRPKVTVEPYNMTATYSKYGSDHVVNGNGRVDNDFRPFGGGEKAKNGTLKSGDRNVERKGKRRKCRILCCGCFGSGRRKKRENPVKV